MVYIEFFQLEIRLLVLSLIYRYSHSHSCTNQSILLQQLECFCVLGLMRFLEIKLSDWQILKQIPYCDHSTFLKPDHSLIQLTFFAILSCWMTSPMWSNLTYQPNSSPSSLLVVIVTFAMLQSELSASPLNPRLLSLYMSSYSEILDVVPRFATIWKSFSWMPLPSSATSNPSSPYAKNLMSKRNLHYWHYAFTNIFGASI